jgi:Flp pilus assembly pilin Flp
VFSRFRSLTQYGEDARESGQALVEYALILMLVTLLAVAALTTIGSSVTGFLSDAAAGVSGG